MHYLLGVDFGGGASKATLLGCDGRVAATHTVEYPTAYPRSGWAEPGSGKLVCGHMREYPGGSVKEPCPPGGYRHGSAGRRYPYGRSIGRTA